MVSVVQVSTYYGGKVGGIETCIRELVHGLKDYCQLEVLCTTNGFESQSQVLDGIRVSSVASPVSINKRPLALQLPVALARLEADVIHYHLPFPLAVMSHLVARPRCKASVVTWHADLVGYPRLKTAVEPFVQAFLNDASAVIVSSKKILEQTQSLQNHLRKCHVVPWGVDPKRFESTDLARVRHLRSSSGRPMILFAGRLVYYKGVDVLIRAMQAVDATLVIAGSGHLEPSLKDLVGKLGLTSKVHFLGEVTDQELANLYHACDIFVLPSLSEAETFGLVQVEAMLCGKPVINTSINSAVPEVSVHGLTGLTVQPGNHAELSQAIRLLVNDAELRSRLGLEARARALANYSQDRYIKGIAGVYESALNQVILSSPGALRLPATSDL